LAYGTTDPRHLLNVRVGAISAFPDEPGHFLDWLKKRHPETRPEAPDFAQRLHYGEYLRELVASDEPRLKRHSGRASSVGAEGGRLALGLEDGRTVTADQVVLALGNLQGEPAYGGMHPRDLGSIAPDSRVLLVGTGLTMVDMVLSLEGRGHKGKITAVSRRGLLPRVHADYRPHSPSAAFQAMLAAEPRGLAAMILIFREECRAAGLAGSDWRAVFDLIRPRTQALWSGLSLKRKVSFIKHLRPYWDVHRHRVAPSIHERLEALRQQGRLEVRAARVLSTRKEGGSTLVKLGPKPPAAPFEASFEAIVDCTGLSFDLTRVRSPLLRSALDQGLVRLGEPPIGLSPAQPSVHVIGPLLRATLWESIAVPELRVQARDLAEKLLA